MTCRELNELLGEHWSGDLPPDVRSRLDRHLLRCPACVAYVRSYRATVRLVRDDAASLDSVLPAEAPEALVSSILDRTVGAAGKPRPRRR